MNCITSVTYSFVLNGSIYGHITPSRGLRQGDPLSPFLFLFCAEGLSSLLHEAQAHHHIQGLVFGPTTPQISHLLYADDSLMFYKITNTDYLALRDTLNTHSTISGQEINFEKSELYFGKSVKDMHQASIANTLHVRIVPCHEKYLGLPAFVGRSKKHSLPT